MTTLMEIPQLLGISIEVYLITALFGLLIFFVFRRFLRNRIESKGKRILTAIIGALILAPIFYLITGLIFASTIISPPEYQNDFDKQRWVELKELRFEMRSDLIESEILNDKIKSEVIDLLGQPDRKDSSNFWIYDLGVSKAGFGWQYNELKINFENEQVIGAELIEVID